MTLITSLNEKLRTISTDRKKMEKTGVSVLISKNQPNPDGGNNIYIVDFSHMGETGGGWRDIKETRYLRALLQDGLSTQPVFEGAPIGVDGNGDTKITSTGKNKETEELNIISNVLTNMDNKLGSQEALTDFATRYDAEKQRENTPRDKKNHSETRGQAIPPLQ